MLHQSNFDPQIIQSPDYDIEDDCNSEYSISSYEMEHDIVFRDIETNETSMTSSDWAEDACELDVLESKRVQEIFDQIEDLLYFDDCVTAVQKYQSTKLPQIQSSRDNMLTANNYNQNYDFYQTSSSCDSPTYRIKQECLSWREQFPHLKICGYQLPCPYQENGVALYQVDNTQSINMDSSFTSKNNQETSPLTLCGHQLSYETSNPNETCFEEILEQDGVYEDYIAIDTKLLDQDLIHRKDHPRMNRGLPPITPGVVISTGILNTLFDVLWTDIISWLKPVFQEIFNSLNKVLPNYEKHLQDSSFHLSSYPVARYVTDNVNLSGLLQISTKTLQTREKPPQQHELCEPDTGRGEAVSRALPNNSQLSTNSQRNFSDNKKPPSRLAHMHGRLAPLELVPNLECEQVGLIRGRSLMDATMTHHNNNAAITRTRALPPLESTNSVSHQHSSISSSLQNNTALHITSSGRNTGRNRPSFGAVDFRPSTTNTLRSEAPLALSYPLNSRRFGPYSHKWPFSLHSNSMSGGPNSNRGSIVVLGHRPLTQTEEDDEDEEKDDVVYPSNQKSGTNGLTNQINPRIRN